MELGKAIRMSRLFNKSGKLLDIALDHGLAYGVLPGIENVSKVIKASVEGGADAVTLHKGFARGIFKDFVGKISLVVKCTSFSAFHPSLDVWVTDVEEAISLGADAIAVGVIIGDERQPEMLGNLGLISEKAYRFGMPLICHIYPKGNLVPNSERCSVENISYAARIAAELGVDIVKTWYTGSPKTFSKVVEAANHAKVVVAGGPKVDDPIKILQMTKEVMEAGAVGVTYGRNVWQYKNPVRMIKALSLIIHEGKAVEEAKEFLLSE